MKERWEAVCMPLSGFFGKINGKRHLQLLQAIFAYYPRTFEQRHLDRNL